MSADPLGGVVITSREIYDAVVRLTGRVDVLIERDATTSKALQDQESRLRAVERRMWPLPSAALLVSAAALAVAIIPRL